MLQLENKQPEYKNCISQNQRLHYCVYQLDYGFGGGVGEGACHKILKGKFIRNGSRVPGYNKLCTLVWNLHLLL